MKGAKKSPSNLLGLICLTVTYWTLQGWNIDDAFGIAFRKHCMPSLTALAASWILFTLCEPGHFACECVSNCATQVEGQVSTRPFPILHANLSEPCRLLIKKCSLSPPFHLNLCLGDRLPGWRRQECGWWGSQRQASPPSGIWCPVARGGAAVMIIIEIKCTINVMRLNYPETIPLTPLCGKTLFHETGSWCQKAWGPLLRGDPLLTCSVSEPSSVSRWDERESGEGRREMEGDGGE